MTAKNFNRKKGKWEDVVESITSIDDITISSERILGRLTAGDGVVEALTKTQVNDFLGSGVTEEGFVTLVESQTGIIASFSDYHIPIINPNISASNGLFYILPSVLFSGITPTSIGLGNVDNTSDLNKPISTAVQNALDDKQDILVSGTTIKTINNDSLLGSGNLSISNKGGIHVSTSTTDTQLPLGTLTTKTVITYDCEIIGYSCVSSANGSVTLVIKKNNNTILTATLTEDLALTPIALSLYDVLTYQITACSLLTDLTLTLFLTKV